MPLTGGQFLLLAVLQLEQPVGVVEGVARVGDRLAIELGAEADARQRVQRVEEGDGAALEVDGLGDFDEVDDEEAEDERGDNPPASTRDSRAISNRTDYRRYSTAGVRVSVSPRLHKGCTTHEGPRRRRAIRQRAIAPGRPAPGVATAATAQRPRPWRGRRRGWNGCRNGRVAAWGETVSN